MIMLAGALSLPAVLPMIVIAQPFAAPGPASQAMLLATAPTSDSVVVEAGPRLRANSIVGAPVYNGRNEKLGTVEDVLISGSREVSAIVLATGGFLGLAGRRVAVPMETIQLVNGRLVMAGMSRDKLDSMPDYPSGAS
jgi:sporulation protein YlmC with PRC-barrel domain